MIGGDTMRIEDMARLPLRVSNYTPLYLQVYRTESCFFYEIPLGFFLTFEHIGNEYTLYNLRYVLFIETIPVRRDTKAAMIALAGSKQKSYVNFKTNIFLHLETKNEINSSTTHGRAIWRNSFGYDIECRDFDSWYVATLNGKSLGWMLGSFESMLHVRAIHRKFLNRYFLRGK